MGQQAHFDRLFAREAAHLQADADRACYVRRRIPESVQAVLDVGCGNGIVAQRLKSEFQVCGLDFSFVGIRDVVRSGIAGIQGSLDALPFADGSFDLVMANEVLEHLGPNVYSRALREIARVSRRYVLVTVPNRDRLTFLREECPRCRSITVPWGHVQSFSCGALPEIKGFARTETALFGPPVPNANSPITRLLYWSRYIRHPLQAGMTCPICGYEAPPDANRGLLGFMGRAVEAVGRRLCPKYPRWILALYSRQVE